MAAEAARLVSALIGPLALQITTTSLALPGLDPTTALVPALVEVLTHGPTNQAPVGSKGPSTVARQQAHKDWRRQRTSLATKLGALLGGLADPLKVCSL